MAFKLQLTLSIIQGTHLVLSCPEIGFMCEIGHISNMNEFSPKIGSTVLSILNKVLTHRKEIKQEFVETKKDQDKLVTIKEVAKLLSVSIQTVRNLTDKGLLTCIKTHGGHRRYSVNSILSFKKEI